MSKINKFEIIVQHILENQREKVHYDIQQEKINYGVSQNIYGKFHKEKYLKLGVKEGDIPMAKDVEELSMDEIINFYYQLYIKNHVEKIVDPNTAYLFFDTLVNLGTRNATLFIQKICRTTKDGIFNKVIISTLNNMNQKDLQHELIQSRILFLEEAIKRNPLKKRNYENWISNLDQLQEQIDKGIMPGLEDQKLEQYESKPQFQNMLGQFKDEIELEKKIRGINFNSMKFFIDVQEDIHLTDLATALLVLSDPKLSKQEKMIKFNLNPVFSLNQEEVQQQEKLNWPDEFVKRNVINDTEFAKVLFESSHQLQQISLGIAADGKTPFKYPRELELCGLKSYQNFGSMMGSQQIYKFILYPQKCVYSYQDGQFLIESIQIKCKAKQIEIMKQQIIEKDIKDSNDQGVLFAEKFSEIYEKISKYYPIFKRLEQLFKAVILATQMIEKNVHIDSDLLKTSSLISYNLPKTISILKSEYQQKDAKLNKSNKEKSLFRFTLEEIDTSCQNKIEQKAINNQLKFNNLTEIDIPYFQQKKCGSCSRMIESQLLNLAYNNCSIHVSDSCYSCIQLIQADNQILHKIEETEFTFHKTCFEVYEQRKSSEFDFDFENAL
ncbi:unnamed protein product (macronuclear) [Paramecium tetraurelia]|uniref:TtsA-like Glycoside hydrolase family 108 domain-containing protein n=1 Tax=Paramecium tetraurelia TaxID=5888 RepID=A0DML6_PARTE|nr:uncharacterized protein GSPATT00018501001 [Paramecium tetraurelia]CAK84283.1 unnamed protein product [Paramecium tetraurelia]|eukprot:XP_001451680.1 hypothetical protein (macronuclear) [Paramecium tetraurelia strain d4-2]